MEIMVIMVVITSLLVSGNLHNNSVLAGSLFAIYSYILRSSPLGLIPFLIRWNDLSALSDITRRIELQSDDFPQEQPVIKNERFLPNQRR